MKIIFTFYLVLLIPILTFSQVINNPVVNKFVEYYNQEEYKKIFELFSVDFKNALPENQAIQFFENFNKSTGKITSIEFEEKVDIVEKYIISIGKLLFLLQIATDSNNILGLKIEPYIERNKTHLILPFNEEWLVFWGGDTPELNHHSNVSSQQKAFDFIIKDKDGKSFKTNGKSNEDYYAFGKPIISPCDGKIVAVIDGIKDNIPGKVNPFMVLGNTVVIQTEYDEYIYICHFKQHSITVRQGENVKQGQELGLCGNSGNSTEPHIHFHIQNIEEINEAVGIKCFFLGINVNGENKRDYSPIKGEKVRNQ